VLRRPRRAIPERGPDSASSNPGAAGEAGENGFWVRWTRQVMARPWLAVTGVSAVLLLLASPVLSLETGTEALGQFPRNSDVRVGNEIASEQIGGATDPVQIVATFSGPPDRALVASFARRLRAEPGLSAVSPPAYAAGSVLIEATPQAPSESKAATALVGRLRDSVVPGTALSRMAAVDVGGETARTDDARTQISGSIWKIIGFVLALSFLVLMVMLRSLVLPLKAVLMNLLSIGAASASSLRSSSGAGWTASCSSKAWERWTRSTCR
jgi:RND superfamily putative drug exporter